MRDIETGTVVLSRRDKRERVKKRTREVNFQGGFVEGEIKQMENFGDKMRRKTFLECVQLGIEE